MSIFDTFGTWFKKTADGVAIDSDIVIKVPDALYYKELAAYCAQSLIANAVSQCEIKCYHNGKQVQDENYYSLNIRPNKNYSASQFWNKVVMQMFRARPDQGAFCFVQNGDLYVADSYQIKEKRPFKGNLYDGVVVDEFELNKTFHDYNAIIFRNENHNAYFYINAMYSEYSALIAAAINAYGSTNAARYIFDVQGMKAGDERFANDYENYLKQPLQKFASGESKIFVKYDGYDLKPIQNNGAKSADDSQKLINMIFEMCGKAYKIPESLMVGNINNMSEVVKEFLTFAVDPITDMIGKTLTAFYYSPEEYGAGNYFRVDTSKINHLDIMEMADAVDKLRGASVLNVEEIRKYFDYDEIGEAWASDYALTKNYTSLEKGGQMNES